MKKILMYSKGLWVAVAALAIGMTGCKNDTPETLPILSTWYENVVDNNLQFSNVDMNGEEITIGISGTRNWTISVPATASWISVNPASGSASDDPVDVKITVAPNDGDARSATLTINATDNSVQRTVVVGQQGADSETTIAEINARITTTETPIGDYFLRGIVVTDIAKGNYTNGSLSIMTEGATTAGNGILLYGEYGSGIVFTDTSGAPLYNPGEEIRVDLSTLSMQAYRGAGASGDDPYVHEIIIPTGTNLNTIISKTGRTATLTPVTITYDQMSDFQNMLIQIENVQSLADNVTTWASATTNFTYRDDAAQTFPVYLAATSEIVGTTFNTGNGTLQGIAYVYGGSSSARSTAQLVPRSVEEVAGLTGARIVGETPQFGVSSQAVAVGASGGTATVSVTGNVDWTATVTNGAANITSGPNPDRGTGAVDIALDFPENTDTENTKTVTLLITTTASVATNSYEVVFTQARASAPGELTATFDFSVIGNWGSNTPLTGDAAIFTDGDVTLTFAQGSHSTTPPAGNGTVVRMYAQADSGTDHRGNTLTVATSVGAITNIEFTYGTTAAAGVLVSTGTFADPYATWTGDAASILFSLYSTTTASQQRHIAKVVVSYR